MAIEHDLIVVTDEVYEHLVFDGAAHPALPRCPACGSARSRSPVGAARPSRSPAGRSAGSAAPAALVAAVRTAKQFLTYVNGGPFQPAIAAGLACPTATSPSFAADLAASATDLSTGLSDAGFERAPAAGHLLRHRRHPAARRRRRRWRSAGRCPSGAAWWRIPIVVFYDDIAPGSTAGALRVLQAARGARPRPSPGSKACGVMKVAAVQHDIVWEDREATFAHLAPMIAAAAGAGARLVVLTEMFSTGFSHGRRAHRRAGRRAERDVPREQAAEHGVWVGGSVPRASPTAARARSTGSCWPAPTARSHRYDKIHPFTYAGEHEHYAAGASRVTVDVEGVRVSLFVCYDLRFADEFWALADDTDCYRGRGQLARDAGGTTGRRCSWRGRSRTRPTSSGVNRVGEGGGLDVRRRQPHHRSAGRGARRRGPHRGHPPGRRRPGHGGEVRARFPFLQDRR